MRGRGLIDGLLGTSLLLMGCPADVEDEDDGGASLGPLTTTAPPGTDDGQPQTTDESDSATMGATSMPPGESTGSEDDDTGATTVQPPFFDLGIPDSPKIDMGCRKVDFLFAIDNSGSMSAQQTQLLASFPGFIQAITATLEGVVDSYHVGVVTSDAYSFNAPGCQSIGALVSQTQSGGDCGPFNGGGRFATEQDDLEEKFNCIANVGTFGSGLEMPVTASVAALDGTFAGPGDCNDGFLRDDAILVLVVITDDPPHEGSNDDAHPMWDTSGWHQAIIDAKNGDEEAMVVIGFVPWTDVSCVVFNTESPNLIDFVTSFGDQGVLASICEPDFGPAFASTVETIVTTCENFEPPA